MALAVMLKKKEESHTGKRPKELDRHRDAKTCTDWLHKREQRHPTSSFPNTKERVELESRQRKPGRSRISIQRGDEAERNEGNVGHPITITSRTRADNQHLPALAWPCGWSSLCLISEPLGR